MLWRRLDGWIMERIGGWLLVYLIGAVPVTLFNAAGLAGRFSEYHRGLIVGIFLVLATPLVLLILKLPSAPMWNIASLWVGAGSISLILLVGALQADETRLREVGATLAIIGLVSIAWATVWTIYFLTSDRVASTFG